MKRTATTVGATVEGAAVSTEAAGSTIGVEAGSGAGGAIGVVVAGLATGAVAVGEEVSATGEVAVAGEVSAIGEVSATGEVVEVVADLTAGAVGGAETGAGVETDTHGVETEEDSTKEVSMTEKALAEEIILKTRK